MDNLNFKKVDLGSHKNMADGLDDLQRSENDGQGITCVKQIVTYLRMGELEKAKGIYDNNKNEIENYSEINDFLIKKLFKEENIITK